MKDFYSDIPQCKILNKILKTMFYSVTESQSFVGSLTFNLIEDVFTSVCNK